MGYVNLMPEKNIILAMDTATGSCSVALWKNGKLAAYQENKLTSMQSARLMPMVEATLVEASVNYSDLAKVISTVGPGSFTGIRVGLAAARGICLAANLPSGGYTTLETIAFGARHEAKGRAIIAILNAGKGEVYYQAFSPTSEWQALYEPRVGAIELALVSVGGDAITASNMLISDTRFAKAEITFPRADSLCALASERAEFSLPMTPYYIRLPDAKPMAVDR